MSETGHVAGERLYVLYAEVLDTARQDLRNEYVPSADRSRATKLSLLVGVSIKDFYCSCSKILGNRPVGYILCNVSVQRGSIICTNNMVGKITEKN